MPSMTFAFRLSLSLFLWRVASARVPAFVEDWCRTRGPAGERERLMPGVVRGIKGAGDGKWQVYRHRSRECESRLSGDKAGSTHAQRGPLGTSDYHH